MYDLGIIKAMNNERTKENNMAEQKFQAGDKVRVLAAEYTAIPKGSEQVVKRVSDSGNLVFLGEDEWAYYTTEVERVEDLEPETKPEPDKKEMLELPEATLDSLLDFVENLIDDAYPDEDPGTREEYKRDVSYQILGTMSEQWNFGFDTGADVQRRYVQLALGKVVIV